MSSSTTLFFSATAEAALLRKESAVASAQIEYSGSVQLIIDQENADQPLFQVKSPSNASFQVSGVGVDKSACNLAASDCKVGIVANSTEVSLLIEFE